ncbi:class A beta-lactamase [Rhodoligotrophos defluvii]|uniref:class A beta-lactamase n=1 Tax=Rhodoligotrophos defluvii TaxID=2561934 RepID=UPI0010C97029|nr:class A beta-lactamase [Rhodoligotrophos defluvii]
MFAAGLLARNARGAAAAESDDPLSQKLDDIEKRLGGRLGAVVIDTATGRQWSRRANERFPLNSTFKAFACAATLARVDAGEEDLTKSITFDAKDLVTYSPVTEKRVGGKGMTLFELCDATMSMSDNSAANMVLGSLGGPQGLTSFMRSIGDDVTRLDRWETELNEATPGDLRDTTTPKAIAASFQNLLVGDVLSPRSRQQLEDWLIGNEVSGPMLRAGLPAGWRIGDRTGAGGHGSRSIVAVIWPPRRDPQKPVIAAIYMTEVQASMQDRNAAFAELGRALVQTLG